MTQAQESRFNTFVTYEWPKAQHMIDDWKIAKGKSGELVDFFTVGWSQATMSNGEIVLMVRVEDLAGPEFAPIGRSWRLGRGYSDGLEVLMKLGKQIKFLHFGIVPTHDEAWMKTISKIDEFNSNIFSGARTRALEATHVCSADDCCPAPSRRPQVQAPKPFALKVIPPKHAFKTTGEVDSVGAYKGAWRPGDLVISIIDDEYMTSIVQFVDVSTGMPLVIERIEARYQHPVISPAKFTSIGARLRTGAPPLFWGTPVWPPAHMKPEPGI